MWDTLGTAAAFPLSHDMPCPYCGHGGHRYLPCSETCHCTPAGMPGTPEPSAAA